MTNSSIAGTVLITGANGFIGKALCQQLLQAGYSLRCVEHHSAIKSVPARRVNYNIDLSRQDLTAEQLAGVDTVIHLAAYASAKGISPEALQALNVAASERLAIVAAKAGVKRFIFISSALVHGIAFMDGNTASQAVNSAALPSEPYTLSKWQAEQRLVSACQHTAMQLVIIRPAIVYGHGVKGNFGSLINAIKRGVPLPFANIKHNQRSILALHNLTDFIQLCMTHPSAASQPWLICDAQPLSTAAILQQLAQALGKPARLWPCPVFMLKTLAAMTGQQAAMQRLTGSALIPNNACALLGWQPHYTIESEFMLNAHSV